MALPVVGVIDMENRDGAVYKPGDPGLIEADVLSGVATVVYTGARCIEEVDDSVLQTFNAVMLRRCQFGTVQLAKLPNIKAVIRMGAGYENVDTAACAAAGVIACNCPDAWVEEVADSTMALMLALIRRSFDLVKLVASTGGWTRQAELQQKGIPRIRGMRLGIVGLGRIGSAVVMRARAFGFDIGFFDPALRAGIEKGYGGLRRFSSFSDLAAWANVVSFHCPYSSSSHHMLNDESLPAVGNDRQGLFVVNCARGGIVDESMIASAIADGRLRGIALDCLETEPNVPQQLRTLQEQGCNVLLTPHAAFYSDEAFVEMRHLAAAEISRIIQNQPAHYQVN